MGSILPTLSKHRDGAIFYELVCEKNLSMQPSRELMVLRKIRNVLRTESILRSILA